MKANEKINDRKHKNRNIFVGKFKTNILNSHNFPKNYLFYCHFLSSCQSHFTSFAFLGFALLTTVTAASFEEGPFFCGTFA